MADYHRYWLSLPVSWKPEDVQAALNVVITALSAAFMFVFVRFCWQHAVKRVAKGKDVALYSLLSLNTLGEVIDVAYLLKLKLVSLRYLGIFAQCVVVVFLSATAVFSGPIARYSTRLGIVIKDQPTPGFLTTRDHSSMAYANVAWNLTYDRLERAGFPRDQLLDYLPLNNVSWDYDASQWNNSWAMTCQYTQRTDIVLKVTGNCSNVLSEVPGLESAFSYTNYDNYTAFWNGFYQNFTYLKDALLFVHGKKMWDYDTDEETYLSMNVLLSAVHLHGLSMPAANDTKCNFGRGAVQEASYTKIECEVRRKVNVPDVYDLAYPDTVNVAGLPRACVHYYAARFNQQSTSDSPISVITPEELVRFYQTYTVVKDVQYRQPVMRSLNVEVSLVQLSAAMLAIILLVAVLTVIGLGYYGVFAIRHRDIMFNTPQSKLDWMMQSIQVEDRPYAEEHPKRLRRTVTVDSVPVTRGMTQSKRLGKEFEAAKYGGRETTTWFLSDSQTSFEYNSRPTMHKGIGVIAHGRAQMVQHDRTPMLKETIGKCF